MGLTSIAAFQTASPGMDATLRSRKTVDPAFHATNGAHSDAGLPCLPAHAHSLHSYATPLTLDDPNVSATGTDLRLHATKAQSKEIPRTGKYALGVLERRK